MAIIKANAYGHGAVPVAAALSAADCLGVARMSEAIVLREAGIDMPIALLGGIYSADEMQLALELRLQIVIHCNEQIGWLETVRGAKVDVWLKIDTGMNRLGLAPHMLVRAIARLSSCPAARTIRVMTHLACADDLEDSTTAQQLSSFVTALGDFDGDISIANSAGILGWPVISDYLGEALQGGRLWNRPGLALYGISPFPQDCGSARGLEPGMHLESTLIAVKKISAGTRIGYGGAWRAANDTVIGIVAAGYGDGYSRHIQSGTPTAINGRRVSVVGRIAMDSSAVDLGAEAEDRIGDRVSLWGDAVPVEEVAQFAATIPYTLVTGITERVERVYED
jgi:alanine racemase